MSDRISPHGMWSSRWAFVLAATGSAVGLGNIWKFPYIAGENGGGAFVLIYILCILLIGVPVMMAEVALGRRGRRSPIRTFSLLAREAGASGHWRLLGWLAMLSGALLLSFYIVIAGWALSYVWVSASGALAGADAARVSNLFADLVSSPARLLLWSSLILAATGWAVARGVKRGLETSINLVMPVLFVLLLVMVIYAAIQGDFLAAVKFLFAPNFEKLTTAGALVALGHAFFTLSLGAGIMVIYGAYLPAEASIPRAVMMVAAADTAVALLAGLAIFPIVFAYGLEPGSGPSLIFQTLPIAFGQMPAGQLLGTLFFVMLVLAAFASTISNVEAAVVYFIEHHHWSRGATTLLICFLVWLFSLGSIASFNIGADWRLFGLNFFELVDYLVSNIMLPAGGFLLAIFAGWIVGRQVTASEMGWQDNDLVYRLWLWTTRLVAPVLIALVFVHAIGLLDFLNVATE
jgi:NSS family neurotransmitter:Na+ symporter